MSPSNISPTSQASKLVLETQGITKRFPGVLANDRVDLTLRRGEILALLGENGAGKSTLMNVVYGLYQADSGEVFVKGSPVRLQNPRDAISLGVGMVHQHFRLVQSHTVAENCILGLSDKKMMIDRKEISERITGIGDRYRIHIEPNSYVWQLSIGEQQRVEILKMLYRNADILILDEPTAVLTPLESQELGRTLRTMAKEGKAVVFISHKLDEVMAFTDRVTVLRNGKNVKSFSKCKNTKR